jgi:hypothetical protein
VSQGQALSIGARIFFKRRGLQLLRNYWAHRWDSPTIRQAVTKNYTPKYFVEALHLDGIFLKLTGTSLLWFRGLFSVGRHLPSGKYIQAPVTDSLKGLGPRQLVFPELLLHQLDALALIGGAGRYRYGADGTDRVASAALALDRRQLEERLVIGSVRFFMGCPPPLHVGWGQWAHARRFAHSTICVEGTAQNTVLVGLRITVPLSEVFWNQFREPDQPWW